MNIQLEQKYSSLISAAFKGIVSPEQAATYIRTEVKRIPYPEETVLKYIYDLVINGKLSHKSITN